VKATFQQGTGGYAGNHATWFDYSGGYDYTSLLHVGANNGIKSLLRFDVTNIPAGATVDEATLKLYYTGRSNSNSLTLGAHGVLAEWIDSQANRVQRKSGVNWNVAGMGSGSDYVAAADGTVDVDVLGAGGSWVELDVTDLAQMWVTNATNNHGVVLLQEAAGGYVTYDFCSELGWSPCSATQAPRLTLRYHHAAPAPAKATFQQGGGGYSGNNATYFDTTYGYNNSYLLQVGAPNSPKALLKFDVSTIPAGKKVDEATLRLYYTGRSNSNSLTLGAHRVLAAWTDSQANWNQRQTGVNWQVAGMGSGSDYLAAADGTAEVLGNSGSWVELDVSDMAQAWINNAADNKGLVVLAEAASGSVVYDFCSELGWSPCTSAQAPKLTVWYH
jgi:azurin